VAVSLGACEVGQHRPPFIIAEMSGNHNGSLEEALRIVDAAAYAGAHAIKLQTFDADAMTLRSDSPCFSVASDHSLWGGRRLWDLYRKAETPKSWHPILFERAAEHEILCFSTPCDEGAVDFLEGLNPPAYKVASFECTDLRLIQYIAGTGRPMIISTGMATVQEVQRAVDAARDGGCAELVLLKCTSAYPALASESNVLTLPLLRDLFDCEVGLSDHTEGVGASVAAVALGATVIEKHLTANRAAGGVDAEFSLEPEEFRSLVNETRRGWESLGSPRVGPSDSEVNSITYRRSIFVGVDLRAGDVLSEASLRRLRPGLGLEPRFIDHVVGRVAACDISAGTPLSWEMVGGYPEIKGEGS
jgi:pseudaminic acid synthase